MMQQGGCTVLYSVHGVSTVQYCEQSVPAWPRVHCCEQVTNIGTNTATGTNTSNTGSWTLTSGPQSGSTLAVGVLGPLAPLAPLMTRVALVTM